ncbi:MAG: hypothetical protein CMD96_06050 [Gammaproteobacteria bacterium]|jgi:hypothetical protein|nr:hypothetical protein [Gammaproteobacteria bacterium]HJP18766.1 sulfotransferase [Nitrospinota bacterium]
MIASNGENLIFLISQPRAGSTLLQLMLSGHADIATTSEPWIALHPIYALRTSGIDTMYDSKLAHLALLDFLKQSGMDISFYKKQVASFLLSLYKQAIEYQKKKFFLDKTPHYCQIIPELVEIFPKAKFIILFRNPLAVLNSILKTWVKDDITHLGSYENHLMDAPRKLVDFTKEYPERCLKVKYEELVTMPEIVLKDICSFLDISYSDRMLEYDNRYNAEWKFGDQVGVSKTSRPIVESLDKWKKGYTSPQERLFALSYLKSLGPELIKVMGYDFNEIKSSINAPEVGMQDKLISWSTLMSNTEGFSKTRLTREMICQILSDENYWSKKTDDLNQCDENYEWVKIIKQAAKRFQDLQIRSLLVERDALLNSFSWKITTPLRAIKRFFKEKK